MRNIVVQAADPDPEDVQRRERLLDFISTGLQRLLSRKVGLVEITQTVDYSADVPRTSNTNSPVPRTDD